MPDTISYNTPFQFNPPVTEASTFPVQLGWTQSGAGPAVTPPQVTIKLTASPTPVSITPNVPSAPTVGVVTATGFSGVQQFAVTYAPPSSPFAATLTASLYLGTNTTGTPAATKQVTVQISRHMSIQADVDWEESSRVTPCPSETGYSAAAQHPQDAQAAETSSVPFVITGRSTPPTYPQRAAAVVCVVTRIVDGMLSPGDITTVASGVFLPQDLFIVTLDPSVRGQGLIYLLYLVDALGEILEVQSQPIP